MKTSVHLFVLAATFLCCVKSHSQTPAAAIGFEVLNYAVSEGAVNGTATITVSIVRSNDAAGVFAVECVTVGGTAIPDEDYTQVRTAVAFAPGETTRTFTVPILDDPFVEGNETIGLLLTNATCGATVASATATLLIVDNDFSAGELNFSAPGYFRSETNLTAQITVTRTGGSQGVVSVQYRTANGTATAGLDYLAANGTLTFADGQISRTFSVSIIDDALVESAETILLVLTNVTGGATFPNGLPSAEATLTITDSDSPAAARPSIHSYDQSGDVLRFGFTGEPSYDYFVEYNVALMSTTWLALTNFRAKNQTIEAIVTDTITNSATRFYRVRKEDCQCD